MKISAHNATNIAFKWVFVLHRSGSRILLRGVRFLAKKIWWFCSHHTVARSWNFLLVLKRSRRGWGFVIYATPKNLTKFNSLPKTIVSKNFFVSEGVRLHPTNPPLNQPLLHISTFGRQILVGLHVYTLLMMYLSLYTRSAINNVMLVCAICGIIIVKL